MATDVQIRISERGGARTAGSFRNLERHVSGLKSRMLSLGAGIGIGVGGAALLKSVVDADAALTRLAIAAGKGPEAIAQLRGEVRRASTETGKSFGDLVAGMGRVVEITGDFDLATSSMRSLGKISNATGSDIESVAATAAELGQKMGIAGNDLERIFDILAVQGKAGAFELKNMAGEFPSLLANLAAFRVKGEGAIRTFGAFLQIARQGKGSAAETSSAVNALMASLRDVNTQKRLRALGIKNVGTTNPVETFMALVRKTKGDATKIATALGGRHEAQSAILPLANMFRETGGFKKLEELRDVSQLGAISADFATWMTTAASQMERAKNEVENVAIEKLTENVRGLAKHGNALVEGIQWAGDHMGALVAGLVALKMGRGLIGGLASARAGSAAAAAAAAATRRVSVQPVFVVNMPGATMWQAAGYGIGVGGEAATTGRKLGTFRTQVQGAGGALAVFGQSLQAFSVGYAIGTLIDELTGLSDAISSAMFEILHPEEARRRRSAATAKRKEDWLSGFSKQDRAAVEARSRYLSNRRSMTPEDWTDMEGGRNRGGAGPTQASLEAVVAELRALKTQQIELTVTDFLGLGRPAVVQARGPKQ